MVIVRNSGPTEHTMMVLLKVLLLVMVIIDVLGTTIVQGLVRR